MINLKSYSVKTDQGPYLQINEDGYLIDYAHGLFAILDGFGGSGIGDKAIMSIKESLQKFYLKIGGDPDATFPFFHSPKYLLEGNALINAMHYAHLQIKKDNDKKKLSSRGGASGIGVALSENMLTFSSVGNCMAGLYRKGVLEVLARSDGFFSYTKSPCPDVYENLPVSAFGLFDDIHLTNGELRIVDKDLVILMTDGVYHRLEKSDMENILCSNDNDRTKINSFFDLANTRENKDNQTIVFLRF